MNAGSTTEGLARAIVAAAGMPLPREAAAAAQNSLFNVAGVAIGASRYEGVEMILRTARRIGGKPVAIVPGRTERADAEWSPIATGFAAHVDDFDDTHLASVIHPSATCFATAIGMLSLSGPSGDQLLRAFALGCEVQLRVGLAINPAHYDAGWHITGTVGVLGAAATAGILLHLNGEQMRGAVAIAASMTLGHRVAFGTMTKPLHPGKAAANGILAARLAARGFTGPPDAIEAERGFANVMSASHDFSRVHQDLGRRYEFVANTFKPYPCGLVAHPGIDAAIAIGERIADPGAIAGARLECHPLVPELMGKPAPRDWLEARFSARHAVAVGLIDRKAGLYQFSDERARSADAAALRGLVELAPDGRIAADEARLRVTLRDGSVIEEHVEHARGSLARPLTSGELFAKVDALVEPILPGRTHALHDAMMQLETAPDASAFIAELLPAGAA